MHDYTYELSFFDSKTLEDKKYHGILHLYCLFTMNYYVNGEFWRYWHYQKVVKSGLVLC
jgi:hypothetical protein